MAIVHCTRGWRGQKFNTHNISEATFLVFLFHLFPVLPFYHDCNPSPPHGNYKRGGKDLQGGGTNQTHTHHPKETWDLLPLSKACNPYYEHFGAWQHE
jgi:hypothetical protein